MMGHDVLDRLSENSLGNGTAHCFPLVVLAGFLETMNQPRRLIKLGGWQGLQILHDEFEGVHDWLKIAQPA